MDEETGFVVVCVINLASVDSDLLVENASVVDEVVPTVEVDEYITGRVPLVCSFPVGVVCCSMILVVLLSCYCLLFVPSQLSLWARLSSMLFRLRFCSLERC